MFKKASIYTVVNPDALAQLETTLEARRFVPPTSAEVARSGCVPVRDGELCMRSHGGILLHFMIEKKVVPSSALKTKVAERCAEIGEKQGFMPGKKATAEIREQVFDELVARALTTKAVTGVWIDTVAKRLIIDSSVVGTLDLILRALMVESGLEIGHLEAWAGADMAHWLQNEDDFLPDSYTIDDGAVLAYPGPTGATVTFKRADLNAPLVTQHITAGADVIQLALTFDSKISFQLQVANQLFGIRALDVLKERQEVADVDQFENDFVLMQLELRALIDSLIKNSLKYKEVK